MSKTLTITSDAYEKLLHFAAEANGLVRSTYLSAAHIIAEGVVSQNAACVAARPGRPVIDYVCCCDLFLSETLRQLDAQGSEIVTVSQCEHQYTIFFRTVAYG